MPVSRKQVDVALLAGLALAALTLLFFWWLSEEVLAGRTEGMDLAIREAINRHASPALTYAMRGVTMFGSQLVLAPLGAAIIVCWVRRGRSRAAVLIAVTMAGAVLLDLLLKQVYGRPRPEPFFGLAAPSTYSFPSGHALASCCFYGALAALRTKRRSAAGWLAAAVLVALIGFSRVYLGVHYPSDIVAGYAAAVIWVLVVRSAYLLM